MTSAQRSSPEVLRAIRVACPYCTKSMDVTKEVPALPSALAWRCRECLRTGIVWRDLEDAIRSTVCKWHGEASA